MASALTAFPEDGDFGRIWYDRFCIEFNSDGGLSPAELRVIRLLLRGYNSGQIAALCFRSVKTISAQKGQAFRRLGVRNDATLLPTLILLGMVTLYTDLNRVHSLEEDGPICGPEAG
ncbi:helix-turn-helix transcriptional regulator [Salmonella enterica subsp. enterica serovar Enteritidis]|uniref:helix-turn-helix domain-containing protein n=1 Tax=Salmonella enterica TaxID=28901 RepID=UPI00141D2B0D|nr:helix-turn-helix transcriptional regulator [Salmonella enterica]EBK3418323.1 LuxR family transcriptional regulator [Salmonella enterica]EBL8946434.1 LuxR family transcriptional regulator [Salmonella enterica]EEE4894572.1 LuxR family transcriptional regulator [Salmonella enterica subsp. enterica serovar Enteritidis]EEL4667263.1 LuxR family transcriptional regulator [Salmonella enterica subsp. enterica serovar Enteritidis]EIU6703803.1 helix-turn-helix transcriptional regulator [Salmonella ent